MPYASNGETRLYYEVEGNGPPMVLSHGFMMDTTSWYDLGYVAELKPAYTLLIMDARGHGASDKPHDVPDYNDKTMAADVLSVMSSAGVDSAHFFGFSMGGRTGLELAVIAPDRFRSFIIASATPGPRTDVGKKSDIRRIEMFQEGPKAVAVAMDKLSPEMDPYRIQAIEGDLEAYLAKTRSNIDRADITSELSNLKVPCLMYAGESDPLSHDSALEAVREIPSARFISLPGLKHMYTFGRTDIVFPIVREFLEGVPPGQPITT